MTEEDEGSKRRAYGIDRTLALSDGVFAFAITLLVLDLFVPTLSANATSVDLWQGLSNEYVSFLNYLLSFLIAGIWWNAHHRNFEHIRASDTALRWLNLLFLLCIALLPFFTKILDQYIHLQLGVVLYAADQTAAGLFLSLLWFYASRNHRLIDKNVTAKAIRFSLWRNAIAPIFFVISMGISFINPSIASLSWYAMFPVFLIAYRLEKRSEKEKSKTKVLTSLASH
jgi:uncharacterized membrane protein